MCHNADGGQRQQPAGVRALAPTAPPMPADHEEREDDREEQERRNAVCDSTPESQAVPQRNRDDIDVGKIRGDHQRGGTESSPPLQPRFSKRSADQGVADVIHYKTRRQETGNRRQGWKRNVINPENTNDVRVLIPPLSPVSRLLSPALHDLR